MGKWIVRIGLGLIVGVVLLGACGLVYQAIGAANDLRNFPPPGQIVAVGDLQMQLNCTGSGSPTVILEALAGGNSTEWGWIQPEVSKFTRVCSYDRAGTSWSDVPTAARTGPEIVADLHALLGNANVEPPYVLVGHSIGGVYARMYAQEYPDEVVGMVLVDSAHPEQVKRYPALRAGLESYLNDASLYAMLARFGLFRLFFQAGGEIDFADLPPQQRAELKAVWASPEYHANSVSNTRKLMELYDNPPALGTLGDMPLWVLTATENLSDEWKELQSELAALSTNTTQRAVQGASHSSLAFRQEHAMQVVAAIQDVVNAVKGQ